MQTVSKINPQALWQIYVLSHGGPSVKKRGSEALEGRFFANEKGGKFFLSRGRHQERLKCAEGVP